jgi:prepilin-type N-terminal cleavage/methylation domain-containing protein
MSDKINIKYNAFTLLEIIVVMGIITIAMALGVMGMVSFQRSAQVHQASSELLAIIKETRNMSQNNVLNTNIDLIISNETRFAYRLEFTGDNQILRKLFQYNNLAQKWQDIENIEDENLKSNIFADIVYYAENCNTIYFENLTGRIYTANSDVNICEITVKHKSQTKGHKIVINFNDNSVKLSNEN